MEALDDADPFGASRWDGFLSSFAGGWRDKDYRQLTAMFDLSRAAGDVLDVGCAVGDGIPVLRAHLPRTSVLSCCDFSADGIDIVRRRFEETDTFVHDIHQPLPRRWDHVVCLQTLEHLDDPLAAMENLASGARRSLIVATPYRNRRPDPDHRWSFDQHDFRDHFDGWRLDPLHKNIYWFRSDVEGLVRSRPSATLRATPQALRSLLHAGRDRVRAGRDAIA